jgi:hypothetical protein
MEDEARRALETALGLLPHSASGARRALLRELEAVRERPATGTRDAR